tara:strand:- start:1800 stop:2189 length:390 start_codon:yes stop_codon:yes gene_type:complete
MALRRVRRRRRASITSLIDVIFLLLLFFMLASTFSTFSEIDISSTASGSEVTADTPVLTLTVRANGLLLEDEPVRLDHLIHRLERLGSGEDTPIVSVTVTDDVTTQSLIDVLSELKRLPRLEVMVMEPT